LPAQRRGRLQGHRLLAGQELRLLLGRLEEVHRLHSQAVRQRQHRHERRVGAVLRALQDPEDSPSLPSP
jgi:hypothetical protein